jgi:DNA-binding Lrp family transcriptional regulator
MVTVDDMNRRIMDLLRTDGKMTYNDVAVKLRRSPSTIRDRIRRLEDDKVILGYVAVVNAERMGMKVEGVLLANLTDGVQSEKLRALAKVPGVTEVLQVSGKRRILVRLNAPDNRTLEDTIQRNIIPIGLKDIELRIVLESVVRFPGI